MEFIEFFKVIFLGIVEGITEWLPISSTGHMILVDTFMNIDASDSFKEMFFVVIQLGAILAVVLIYFKRLFPVTNKNGKLKIEGSIMTLWGKILIASIPAAVIGLMFDDRIDELFYNYKTVAVTLILYGIAFIIVEIKNRDKSFVTTDLKDLTIKTALFIGFFQVLALIPGTSRSGATIIGAMLIGTSRTVAAEFTFFLAIPVMFGASFLKLLKFGFIFSSQEVIILTIGMVTAFLVSILSIKFLMKYIKKHDFKVFGYYRIILGAIILIYFSLI